MGCQLNLNNRSETNFSEEGIDIKLTPREKKMVINQIRIRPQAIITQYKMFPENIDLQNKVRKENSRNQSLVFNSARYVPLSTIQPAEQPQSPNLTPLLLIKQMGNSEFKDDNEINQETMHVTEKPSKHQKKQKPRRIDMKTLEAQF